MNFTPFTPKNTWIGLALLTILLGKLLPASWVEQVYSRGIFTGIRWFFTAFDSWWPFAAFYVFWAGILTWIILKIKRFKRTAGESRKHIFLRFLHGLLFFVSLIICLFQWLWGFNYSRLPVEHYLQLDPQPMSVADLKAELDSATNDVLRVRELLSVGADSVVQQQVLEGGEETYMRKALVEVLQTNGYPAPGTVRGRTLFPKGILLRISTAGFYLPFSGEGNIDAGLHYLQSPFVVAHEMSHAYGFGDEGTCNFWAYLACNATENPYIRYIGFLDYWRTVAGAYRNIRPDEYSIFRKDLPAGFIKDLDAIYWEMEKYPDIFPQARNAVYNTYLQSQGIEEGMQNYNRVIMLVADWRKRTGIPAH